MTKKFILKGVCALVLTVSLPSWSAEICPAEIKTTQAASDIPSGYGVADDGGPHRLQNINVYNGLAKDMASLIPDFQKKTASTWKFGKQPKNQVNEVACHYSRTRIVLTKALAVGTKSCTATVDPTIFGEIKSFTCQ